MLLGGQRIPCGGGSMWRRKYQEEPAHWGVIGVGLAGSGAAAAGTGSLDPVLVTCQRGLAVRARLKVGDVRQSQRQAALRQGLPAALVAVHHGDGLAPVTLTAEHPVAQLVVDLIAALAVLFQPSDHLLFGIDHGQAVQEAGVDQRTGSHIGKGSFVRLDGCVARRQPR